MSVLRHDLRSQAPQKYGKPTITYPYGSTRFPRIVEVRTAKKGTDSALLIPYLTPYRDQRSYPGAVLVEQTADCGDDTDKNITETYEVLPGPIFVEVSTDQDTGIPVLVSRQKRAATDLFDEGELVVPALSVVSVGAGNPCTVTLNVTGLSPADHLLSPRMWVRFAGTQTSLDGTSQRILEVPAANQVTLAVNVASGGSGGTMTPVNRIVREIKVTDNVNINVKVDSCIAALDVTTFDENIAAWKEYSFPDALIAIKGYADMAESTIQSTSQVGFTWTGDGTYGLQIQNGYRGPCQARRLRLYSMGPVPDTIMAAYSPTFVMPSSGTVAIRAESFSQQYSTGGTSTATSYTFKTGTIPPVLNAGDGIEMVSAGQAQFYVDLPKSVPTQFTQGEIITLVEQPQKLRCGLWQVYVWQLVVPYTSGVAPSSGSSSSSSSSSSE